MKDKRRNPCLQFCLSLAGKRIPPHLLLTIASNLASVLVHETTEQVVMAQ
jgi:hypothetical protein